MSVIYLYPKANQPYSVTRNLGVEHQGRAEDQNNTVCLLYLDEPL